uniref:Uncharacterized protein n=1 Tax=Falco tinnunculus TaxID=100819 RepID=A0A8C4V045_FALTI
SKPIKNKRKEQCHGYSRLRFPKGAFFSKKGPFLCCSSKQEMLGKVPLPDAVALSMTVQAFQPRPRPCSRCPFDWIGYRGKCYYFLEVQQNWTSSQDNCSALGASLAMLDSLEDLVRRHEGVLSTGGGGESYQWGPAGDVLKPSDLPQSLSLSSFSELRDEI